MRASPPRRSRSRRPEVRFCWSRTARTARGRGSECGAGSRTPGGWSPAGWGGPARRPSPPGRPRAGPPAPAAPRPGRLAGPWSGRSMSAALSTRVVMVTPSTGSRGMVDMSVAPKSWRVSSLPRQRQHQVHQGARGDAGSALHESALVLVHAVRGRHVDVHPRRVLREEVEELGGAYRPAVAVARVLDAGQGALEP